MGYIKQTKAAECAASFMGNFIVELCEVEMDEVDYDKYVFIDFKLNTVSFRQAVAMKSWKHLVFLVLRHILLCRPR